MGEKFAAVSNKMHSSRVDRQGSSVGPSLLSIPDPVILSIFSFLRFADVPSVEGASRKRKTPGVVVGEKTSRYNDEEGRFSQQLSSSRALGSTCTRLRDLFRHQFVTRFETTEEYERSVKFWNIRDIVSAKFVVNVDGTTMECRGKVFNRGAVGVLQRYAAGLEEVALYPQLIFDLYTTGSIATASERCSSACSTAEGADVNNNDNNVKMVMSTLRTLFPRLKRIRLEIGLTDFLRYESGCTVPMRAEEASLLNLVAAREVALKIRELIPRDLEGVKLQISDQLHLLTEDSELCGMVCAILTDFEGLTSVELVHETTSRTKDRCGQDWAFSDAMYFLSPNFCTLKSLSIELPEFPGNFSRLPAFLPFLEELELDMRVRDKSALSESLPKSLRSFRWHY